MRYNHSHTLAPIANTFWRQPHGNASAIPWKRNRKAFHPLISWGSCSRGSGPKGTGYACPSLGEPLVPSKCKCARQMSPPMFLENFNTHNVNHK